MFASKQRDFGVLKLSTENGCIPQLQQEKFMKDENPRFKRIDDVSDITGMGKSTILAWESQGRFPKAVRLSPTFRVWLESDVHKWILAKHAELAGNAGTVGA